MSLASSYQQGQRHRWAIVLAGGEGRRLVALTTTPGGTVIPKQYCSLWGGPSLLQEALARAQGVVARERVCTVVSTAHRHWWEGPLWSLPARNTIVQPEGRGTAIGVLLPLLHILRRDPAAQVLILPSDHNVLLEPVLQWAMDDALTYAGTHRDAVVLLGFWPNRPDKELGYIVPGTHREAGMFGVAEFVEKPAEDIASKLIGRRALWNGLVVAASGHALLGMFQRRFPDIVTTLQQAVECDAETPSDGAAAANAYPGLPTLDFSNHILHGQESRLLVHPVADCGWSDLGCPAAVAKVVQLGRERQTSAMNPWAVSTLTLSDHDLSRIEPKRLNESVG